MEITASHSLKIRYVVVGIWNTAFSFGMFWVLLHLLEAHIGYLAVLTIAYPITVIQSHFMQRKFVWLSNSSYKSELLRFTVIYVALYLANIILLFVAVDMYHFEPFSSQVLISLALIVFSFYVNRRWTFLSPEF